jgi:hypothetical protein
VPADQTLIQWAVGQGVAIVVLAYVLIRVDARLGAVQTSLDELLAYLRGKADAESGRKSG